MEITTIVGIVVAIIIIAVGYKIMFRKNSDATPSLESELYIDPVSQKPVIPRHVRDQLKNTGEHGDEEVLAISKSENVDVNSTDVSPQIDVPSETPSLLESVKTEDDKKADTQSGLNINQHVETAAISDFSEESSLLDAHLHEQSLVDEESALSTAEEYIVLNVYPERRILSGEKTLKVLMKYGLRYGEMACFHRYNEDGDKLLFSVLQITDEGAAGFDLEALSTEEVKGLAFFLALPHDDVQNAFDTMVSLSGLISREIEGVVYDQNNQEFTPQLREHWRHQAIDYRAGQQSHV